MSRNRLFVLLFAAATLGVSAGFNQTSAQTAEPGKTSSNYRVQEFMVPMRDGVRLQTVIVRSKKRSGTLPILLQRTPYGVPTKEFFDKLATENGQDVIPSNMRELEVDGYIFVTQNLRGRFKSQGDFEMTSRYDPQDPKQANETNDAYDTVEWLVKNVPDNNGRVGIWGVSYAGLTAGLALLHPHPALKAVSEQAAPVNQWMNDDFHRYGALRESYALEYSVMEGADKNKNSDFDFEIYDTYEWYLKLGPLANLNAKYLHRSNPFWNNMVAHPDYDQQWKKEAWVDQLHSSTVPNLNVAGFWDQEDPWGPWQIFRNAEEHDPDNTNFLVAGPWFHGEWAAWDGESIGAIPFGGHKTGIEFRQNILAPFFRHYLHEQGDKPAWNVTTFQTGSNTWRTYVDWPLKNATPTNLYLHSDGTLSFNAPTESERDFRQYISDPANPVPYRVRPIAPTYGGPGWRTWEVADQRFVQGRPDVLSFVSEPLEQDLTVTGELSAELFASTSGTDSDFVVKLIDLYPEKGQKSAIETKPDDLAAYSNSLNGYELPIAMEVRRGRYLGSYEHPASLRPNIPEKWPIPLRAHDHVFLKGHRLMVQVQSTWFPVIDRNPQKFSASIYEAKDEDYVAATQHVYCSPKLPSHVVLPVVR